MLAAAGHQSFPFSPAMMNPALIALHCAFQNETGTPQGVPKDAALRAGSAPNAQKP
jgi:hypothetical protein